MDELLKQVIRVLRGSWRFRWLAMAVTWLIALGGWTAVLSLPNEYEAVARFYIDASSRLRNVVRELGMEPDVASRVFLVRQAMLGRPQLEKVSRETDLDLRAKTDEQREGMLRSLHEKINVGTIGDKNLFEISFRDHDREMSVAVVRTLLNTFVEDVIEKKDSDTQAAASFLQEQLRHYSGLLDSVELQIEEFKRANAGLLPGTAGGHFERMQAGKAKVTEIESELRIEASKRDELRRQLDYIQPYVVTDSASDVGQASGAGGELWTRVTELEAARNARLVSVTEQHPDIVAIDAQIAHLQAQIAGLESEAPAETGDGVTGANNPLYLQVQVILSQINLRVTELEGALTESRTQLRKLEDSVGVAPEIERRYTQLLRDYDKYKGLYDEIRMQTERERIGRVGDEKDVVTFNIIDPPRAGLDPVAPDRPTLLILVLLGAIAAGGGLAFLLHQVRPVFQDLETLSAITGARALGSVGLSWFTRQQRQDLRDFALFSASALALVTLWGAVFMTQDVAVSTLKKLLG